MLLLQIYIHDNHAGRFRGNLLIVINRFTEKNIFILLLKLEYLCSATCFFKLFIYVLQNITKVTWQHLKEIRNQTSAILYFTAVVSGV